MNYFKNYRKCYKISNTFSFCSQIKCCFFRAGIHKFLVGIANREDPDQTKGLPFLSRPFWQAIQVEILNI